MTLTVAVLAQCKSGIVLSFVLFAVLCLANDNSVEEDSLEDYSFIAASRRVVPKNTFKPQKEDKSPYFIWLGVIGGVLLLIVVVVCCVFFCYLAKKSKTRTASRADLVHPSAPPMAVLQAPDDPGSREHSNFQDHPPDYSTVTVEQKVTPGKVETPPPDYTTVAPSFR